MTDRALVDAALSRDVASIIHLAALPGGAAEADPSLSFDVNVAGSATLMRRAAECLDRPRFVFASSIAVLGNPLPKDGVTDETTPQPTLIYGIHKQMTEAHLDGMTHRGDLDGLAIRLPGIVARPSGNSGLKSAFMSDVFHALNSHRHFVSPVSAEAELWLMSNAQISTCLLHALDLDETRLTGPRVFNLPALHISMKTLVSEIADQTGAAPDLVTYTSDAKLEAAFGRYPPLSARTAERAGFRQDGDVKTLVHNALTHRSV